MRSRSSSQTSSPVESVLLGSHSAVARAASQVWRGHLASSRDIAQERGAGGHRLHAIQRGRVVPLHGVRLAGHRQQPGGKRVARYRARPKQLWLTCGSDRGGRAAAACFSLLASCKRHGHDPFACLRDVLRRLPALLPTGDRDALRILLPDRWQSAESICRRFPRWATHANVFGRSLTTCLRRTGSRGGIGRASGPRSS